MHAALDPRVERAYDEVRRRGSWATPILAPAATPARPDPGDLLTGRIAALQAWLTGLDAADLGDRDRIRVVAALEELTGSVAGAQARMTAAYASSQRSLGCSTNGVAAEVGLARRVGLSRAARLVAAARTLVEDLPETLEHLESGRLSEARAVLVAGQVSGLEPAARQEVDECLAEDLPRLGDAEVRDAVDAAMIGIDPAAVEARRHAACRQRRVTVRAAPDGMAWLSIHTTAVEAAAALNTLHAHAASVLAGTGGLADLPEDAEGRGHAEVMADAALSRLTGRTLHEGPPVEVALVMTDTALLRPRSCAPGEGPTSSDGFERAVARVVGIGPIPAAAARALIRRRPTAPPSPGSPVGPGQGKVGSPRLFEGPDWDLDDRTPQERHREDVEDRARWRREDREATRVTIRRLYTSADRRNPLAIDARRRLMPAATRDPEVADDAEVRAWFARLRAPARPDDLAILSSGGRCARGLLRLLVLLRDQRCRVPWCTAPIRHLDHVTPHRDGGQTAFAAMAGDCAGHNLAKEDPGHTVTVTHDGTTGDQPHTIAWTTPTGHTYPGINPPILGWGTTTDPADRPAGTLASDEPSPLERQLTALLAA